jgi:purine-cytosine permease-like protein
MPLVDPVLAFAVFIGAIIVCACAILAALYLVFRREETPKN